MPAYNCEKFVAKAIESILSQTHERLELLISDDGSTDNTKSIIDDFKDKRIRRFHNQQNLGYLKTSNKLIAECQGSYITFQDADDYCACNRLEILLQAFTANPSLGCVGSSVVRVDENDTQVGKLQFKSDYKSIRNDLPNNFNCVGSTIMISKEVFDKVGLYDCYFDRCGSEDLYWYGKVAFHFETINIAEALYYYRSTSNSISNEVNKSFKKIISIDLVRYGLKYYYRTGKNVFEDRFKTFVLEQFLIGKSMCWSGLYRAGVLRIVASIAICPIGYVERYSLLKAYAPKVFHR